MTTADEPRRPRSSTPGETSTAGPTPVLRLLPALAWMGVIFALSHRPDLPDVGGLPSEITAVAGHLGAYAVLAVLLWWGLPWFGGRQRLVVAFVVSVLYGVSDEWHQSFVPGRHPDVLDVVTDAVGAAAGLVVLTFVRRTRLRSQGAARRTAP